MTKQRKRALQPRRRTSGSAGPSWTNANGAFIATATYVAVLSLFGGGLVGWTPGTIVVVVATVFFATLVAWFDGFGSLARAPLLGQVVLIGIAALPLLQILPLPPSLWQTLPGQQLRQATLALAGVADHWQPLSVEPVSTALAAILTVGFVALVTMLLRLTDADFRRVLRIVLALLLLGIAVGLLQVVSGGQLLRFQINNPEANMLGFFANKNHMALAIACSILLVGLVISRDTLASQKRRAAVIGYTIFALVCIVTTNSRAGLGLGALAGVIVCADLARGVALRYRLAALAGMAVLALVIMSSSAFETVGNRVDNVGSDLRWQIASWSWPLVERYWTLGSGLASYKVLFSANEQLVWVKPTFVNAAHNDYLQLVIEAGIPGCLLLALLFTSVVGHVHITNNLSPRASRRREAAFGYGVLLLFVLHSAVDYPLRRPAAWVLFAIALTAVYRARSDGTGLGDEATKRADPKRLAE